MTETVGDLWSEVGRADLILVTTNATIKKDGTLVMGRGAAMEAAHRYPGLARILGDVIARQSQVYGVVIVGGCRGGTEAIGAFQVKRHFRDKADPAIIRVSTDHLRRISESGRYARIAMNFPGIGNGKLTRDEVLPIISTLPENVFVYRSGLTPTVIQTEENR